MAERHSDDPAPARPEGDRAQVDELSEPTLDDVFLQHTGRSLRDAATCRPTRRHEGLHDTRLLYQRFALQILRNPVWLAVALHADLYLALFTRCSSTSPADTPWRPRAPGTNVLDGFSRASWPCCRSARRSAGFTTIFELRAE